MTSQNHAGAGAPATGAPASAAATNIPADPASPSPAASTTAASTATAAGHTEAPLAQASPTQAEHPTQAPLAQAPLTQSSTTQTPLTQTPLTQPSTTHAGRRRRRVVHLGPKDRERVAQGANLEQVVHEALGKVDAERPAWSREDLRREDPSAHANDARLLGDVPPHYGNGA
mgnify:CR=1 FL=1